MAKHPTTSRVEAVALVEGYVVLIERGPESHGAYIPDLPGCIAVGDSAEEVVGMMREAGEVTPAPSSRPIPVAAE
jgi:predicted RNase H-like HicB family nuclease